MILKCTIIIPTYNRPQYLKRILNYYTGFEENYKIIIADSSSDENKRINKKNISLFSVLDIQYIEKYTSKIKPIYKWSNALNYVNTKYCVFCADDDFITPNGINKSVDFLENNQDFSCAHGHYISFYLKTNKKRKQRIYWTPIYPYDSIVFPDAKSRLNYNFCSYYPTLYAVHRTDLLKMLFKETIEFADDDRFGELLPSMLDSVYGKIIKLDCLYCAREIISDSAGHTSKNLNDFMKNGTYNEKYARFRECLTKAIVSEEDISKEKAQKLIDKAMNKYFGSSMFKLKLKAGLKRIIENNVLLKEFYNIYRRFKTNKKHISVLDRSPAIEYDNQENPYYEDFIRIKEAVEKGITE